MTGVPDGVARISQVDVVCRHVLPSTALTCALVELPPLLHGATLSWVWGAIAAVLGSVAAIVHLHGRDSTFCRPWQGWWPCALAAGAGVTVDFFALPPDIMISLCRSAVGIDFGLEAIAAHIRLMPATSMVMLLVIGAMQWRTYVGRRIKAAWVRVLPAIAFDYAAMMAAMVWCVEMLRAMAAAAHVSWTADGMCLGMMGGMLFSPILARLGAAGRNMLRAKRLYG